MIGAVCNHTLGLYLLGVIMGGACAACTQTKVGVAKIQGGIELASQSIRHYEILVILV